MDSSQATPSSSQAEGITQTYQAALDSLSTSVDFTVSQRYAIARAIAEGVRVGFLSLAETSGQRAQELKPRLESDDLMPRG